MQCGLIINVSIFKTLGTSVELQALQELAAPGSPVRLFLTVVPSLWCVSKQKQAFQAVLPHRHGIQKQAH